ncbi:MAG: hypothetical protein ACI9HY_002792 [Planctomycetaceae bacterium]|jgi:hypothetical protein
MDWTGNLSSAGEGLEVFQLAFLDPSHSIDIRGKLGRRPEFLGSVIEIRSNGFDLGSLILCIDQPLTKVTPFETSLLLKRLDNGWKIQDWKLSSSIFNARAQVHLAINDDVNGHANFSTTNIQKLPSTLEYDAGMKAVSLDTLKRTLLVSILALTWTSRAPIFKLC